MFAKINSFMYKMMERRDEGQGLVEYALILLLVSVVVIVVLSALGVRLNEVFQNIIDALAGPAA